MDIDDACDYIIARLHEAGAALNLLKLQKLLYYVQAWHWAFHGRGLFVGRFQAWVHGPVNREIYDRFRETKSLYSPVFSSDVRPSFSATVLPPNAVRHINSVLDVYGQFTGDQLEEMTHREDPWIRARGEVAPNERCENLIDEPFMGEYYAKRIKRNVH